MRQIYIVIYIYIFPEALSEEKDKYLTVVDQICSQSSGRIAFCVYVCVFVGACVWLGLSGCCYSVLKYHLQGRVVMWSGL